MSKAPTVFDTIMYKSLASARSRDITFKGFVPWFHILYIDNVPTLLASSLETPSVAFNLKFWTAWLVYLDPNPDPNPNQCPRSYPHPNLISNPIPTKKWSLLSRLAEHWSRDHLKGSFASNSSELHFCPLWGNLESVKNTSIATVKYSKYSNIRISENP